jgi:hypothetical protein
VVNSLNKLVGEFLEGKIMQEKVFEVFEKVIKV